MGAYEDAVVAAESLALVYERVVVELAVRRDEILRARDELHGRLAHTRHPLILQALGATTLAARRLDEAREFLRRAIDAARAEVASLDGGVGAGPVRPRGDRAVSSERGSGSGSGMVVEVSTVGRPASGVWARVPDVEVPEWVGVVGRGLPVRRPVAPGRLPDRTTGVFRGERVESGGGDRSLAEDLEPHRGMGPLSVTFDHVEGKVAARMRREGLSEGEVVVNNVVCGNNPWDRTADYTCQRVLPSVLPSSSGLTVWGTVDGGVTWWRATYEGTGERIRR